MYDLTVWDYVLIGANILLYSFLVFQLYRRRFAGVRGAEDISDAFAILGDELTRAIPTIPRGYTWREAIREAKKMKLSVDWTKVAQETDAYEAFRYGGLEEARSDYGEVLALAKELKRRR